VKLSRHLLITLLLLALAGRAAAHPGAETSIARLDPLIAAHPGQQALYIKRGAMYSHRGQWQPALRDFELARGLGDSREVGFELGLLHYHRGQYTPAQAELSRYLELHRAHPDALLFRARAAQAGGATDAALADFQTYFTLAKKPHPGDLLAAARLLAAQPQAGAVPALELLDQGMARLGLQPQLQRYAVTLELQRGNLPQALGRWQALGVMLGHSPQWQVEMAELLLIAERADEATSLLDQARAQLNELRPTPARLKLQDRIEQLRPRYTTDVDKRNSVSASIELPRCH
jgi:predicted Zn-dependent protease